MPSTPFARSPIVVGFAVILALVFALIQLNFIEYAYVADTLGTLIGADLTNLHRLRGLGAPFVSVGGAGTFDGIFVTGILAVLLA